MFPGNDPRKVSSLPFGLVVQEDVDVRIAFTDVLALSSSVGICKEIYLITVGLTEANVATVLAGWLSLMNWTTNSTG